MRKLRNLGAFERRVVYLCVVLFGAFLLLFSKLPSQIAAMEKQREWDADFYEFAALFSEIYNDILNRYVDDDCNARHGSTSKPFLRWAL